MSEAILIVGGSPRFKISAEIFTKFLRNRVGISNICTIETAYLNHADFQARFCKELGRAISCPTRLPVLVDYIGHGWPGQWTINEDTGIAYDIIARILTKVQKEILL